MKTLDDRLSNIQALIRQAEHHVRRPKNSVRLVAVSKQQSIDKIEEAIAAGQYEFGENYLQEALAKMSAIDHPDVVWHFIGAIQSNKTKDIAEHFAWVHSVDRIKIAQRLDKQRPLTMPPLNVCIQVNLSGETTKHGTTKEQVYELATAIQQCKQLRLRGLMALPKPSDDIKQQQQSFQQYQQLFLQMNDAGYSMDTLSMGMSNDFQVAIANGATMVRIGTAIFGSRGN